MRFKLFIILFFTVFLVIFGAGCKDQSRDVSVRDPENTLPAAIQDGGAKIDTAEVNQKEGDAADAQETNLKYGVITDPTELEKLWQEYLYDAIATIGNSHEFNSAAEIDPVHIAQYSWFKYIAEHGRESLELANENSRRRVFPVEAVLEYAQRYFNLTTLNVTAFDDRDYDPERRAFIFNLGSEGDRPRYNEGNPWGIKLGEVTRNSDGTITAVLKHYDSSVTRRVERTRTFTLKPREDGSLYFISGREEWVNNNLVSLTGDFQRFDKINGFDDNMQTLAMLGEYNDKVIIAYGPYDKKKNGSLMLLNPENMEVEKELNLGENFTSTDVTLTGERIVVRLKDRIIIVKKNLEQLEELSLPKVIKDKITRELQQGTYFGGYDISTDLTRIIYSDEEGVKLFDLADSSEKLLASTKPVTGTDLVKKSYHSSPRFVANDQKVITTMTGYESAMGYTLYDLQENTSKTYNITGEASSSRFIRYDTGVLEVKGVRIKDKETSELTLQYLDFKTGHVKEIELGDLGDGGYIRFPDLTYVGENDAAFITSRQGLDYSQGMSYLHRLDLDTLTVETNIITVKAAQTYILGVLSDGRVLFWYDFNPSENGVCLTKYKK
ncbi:hypothetical protein MFMK1_001960 [Metallumcola ferriviriculae]|uniref:Uncharacterized protein n=1 Tax=Metallumcola ferriviriculae TaxID=3039180 RepID=A0AAU0ULZ0_9FIRM|nr:hypothetical protein MFMK1_001960 [Desulfitibacteraceae bacterium MK1]